MKNSYTIPKLSKSGKSWYIHFRINGKQHRVKNELNRIKDLKQREIEFNIEAKFILNDLKSGWNPDAPGLKKEKSILTVIEAFDLTLKNKKEVVKNASYLNHVYKIKRIKAAIVNLGIDNVKVVELKSSHYETVLEKTVELYNLSNFMFNEYKRNLSTLLNALVDLKILKNSFKLKVKNKKTVKKVAHIPASKEDILRIKNHLKPNFPHFYIFWATMFHTGIRRNEMLRIQLHMVDLKNDSIFMNDDVTKNASARITPINKYLKPLLESLHLEDFPPDYYLFGTHDEKFKPKFNVANDFTPAANQLRSWIATDLWRQEVKIFLGIDMTLYATKKHGANEKILAGMSKNSLRELLGHGDEATTDIYITNLKEIARKEILEKSPDF